MSWEASTARQSSSISFGSGGGSSSNWPAMGAPCFPSSAERKSTQRGTRGTTWLGSSTSMATRARRRAPASSSVDGETSEGGGERGSGGRGMKLGFSQTSPGEGISPEHAGSCLAAAQCSLATCLPAWRGGRRMYPPPGGLGRLGLALGAR